MIYIHLCASKVNEDNFGAFDYARKQGGKNQSDCRDCYQGPIRLQRLLLRTNQIVGFATNNQSDCRVCHQEPITLQGLPLRTSHIVGFATKNQSHCRVATKNQLVVGFALMLFLKNKLFYLSRCFFLKYLNTTTLYYYCYHKTQDRADTVTTSVFCGVKDSAQQLLLQGSQI